MFRDSGILNQKSTCSYISPMEISCEWDNVIWSSSIPLISFWFYVNFYTAGCLRKLSLRKEESFHVQCAFYITLRRSLFLISFLNVLMPCLSGLDFNKSFSSWLFYPLMSFYLLLSLLKVSFLNSLGLSLSPFRFGWFGGKIISGSSRVLTFIWPLILYKLCQNIK